MTKHELRSYIRKLKSQHTSEQLSAMSDSICENIIADGLWRSAGTVLLYHPLADEVDTRALIRHAVMMGKRVLLPVVVGYDLELRLYEGEGSMVPGAFGILEPAGAPFTEYQQIDLAIIPGMAFDPQGHRLGRGKGFYDRLLPHLTRAYLIGICFPFQLLDNIPCEDHDIQMNEVVST